MSLTIYPKSTKKSFTIEGITAVVIIVAADHISQRKITVSKQLNSRYYSNLQNYQQRQSVNYSPRLPA